MILRLNLRFSYAKMSDMGTSKRKKIGWKKVIIIGGGASGITAAISAARMGVEVLLIDHMDRIGKKILSTGNGKCNYTNRTQGVRFYRGEDPAFVLPVFRQFGFEETIRFFHELGIFPKERDGYFYPASGQASSVLDVLMMELRRLDVDVRTGCEILSVRKKTHTFEIQTRQGTFSSDSCIFACGGMAFPKSGSDGSAFPHIEAFGHTFTSLVPALVQMKAKQSFFKSIAGIRADSLVQLYINDQMVCQDRGELQLTKEGISGIPAFQVSRYAAKALANKQTAAVRLDFMPDLSVRELKRELEERFYRGDGKTAQEALIGMISKNLIPVFLKQSGILLQHPADQVSKKSLAALTGTLKQTAADIVDVEGFERAQACAGGVHTSELDAHTLESRLICGLYFAGEVIDIDGMCGGYNLQWAWSSGYVAGMHAAGLPTETTESANDASDHTALIRKQKG